MPVIVVMKQVYTWTDIVLNTQHELFLTNSKKVDYVTPKYKNFLVKLVPR